MLGRRNRLVALTPRLLVIASLALALLVLVSVARTQAVSTHQVRVGGEAAGEPFTPGVVWFNGFDPGTILIFPGDTIVWDGIGGVHTVTSTVRNSDGSFAYDSSPLFTPEGAIADLGPGMLLGPGTVWELDTSALAPGTYNYVCKIHPGMAGTLTVTAGAPGPTVKIIAGFGDRIFAQQAYVPADVTATQGTIVQWTLLNPTEPHTITHAVATGAPAFDSSPNFPPAGAPPGPPPVILPGQSFQLTFNTAGTFTYFCKVHAWKVGETWVGMVGTVHVVPSLSAEAINSLTVVSYIGVALAAVALVISLVAIVRRKP